MGSKTGASPIDTAFPCSFTISTPLPTRRLASFALQALQVDAELSPLVRRSFFLKHDSASGQADVHGAEADEHQGITTLCTEYKATTNRMLRVATNGFMESLTLVLAVMEQLDVDTATT